MKVTASAKEELAAYVECMWGSMGWNTRLSALNIGRGARGGQQRLDGMSRGEGTWSRLAGTRADRGCK